jgi:hypothetical protein
MAFEVFTPGTDAGKAEHDPHIDRPGSGKYGKV